MPMKLRTLLILFSAFFTLSSFAQQVSVEDAARSAQKMFTAKTRAHAPVELAYTSSENGLNHFYVFNAPAPNGGFVIVGADQAAPEILGYSENGSFDYNTIPENFKWWLSQYDLQIAEGIRLGVNAREIETTRAVTKTAINPLITTKWDQTYPYNSQLPDLFTGTDYKSNNRLATGCVATAMAQVMKYHKYPEKGIGSATCSGTVNGVAFSANFGETTYNWTAMKDSYSSADSHEDAAAIAVATLMYHCGVAVDMGYGTLFSGGSGAAVAKVGPALINYFGYNKSLQYLTRNKYSDSEWEDIVYNELANARPVLYGGQSKVADNEGGHAFVCDGYDGSKYHINWGWGGACDGYYAITGSPALDPDGSGSGGAGTGAQYKDDQEMVIGIEHSDDGGDYVYSMEWVDVVSKGYLRQIYPSVVKPNTNIYQLGGFQNNSLVTINPSIGVKLDNGSTTPTIIPVKSTIGNIGSRTYLYYNGPTSITIPSGISEGYYTISLVFKVGEGEWKEMYSPYKPVIQVSNSATGATTKNISYSLTSVGVGTLILPFAANIPTGIQAYTCESVSGSTLVLTEVSTIEQFKPYIIMGTAGTYDFSGNDIAGNATYTYGLLKGTTLAPYKLQKDDYILQTQDSKTAFYKVGEGSANGQNANIYRCVLNLNSSLTCLGLPEGDGTTGISEISDEEEASIVGIYSLDGTPQSALKKGVNILKKSNGTSVTVIVK